MSAGCLDRGVLPLRNRKRGHIGTSVLLFTLAWRNGKM